MKDRFNPYALIASAIAAVAMVGTDGAGKLCFAALAGFFLADAFGALDRDNDNPRLP
jgi:hypothetical protein